MLTVLVTMRPSRPNFKKVNTGFQYYLLRIRSTTGCGARWNVDRDVGFGNEMNPNDVIINFLGLHCESGVQIVLDAGFELQMSNI